MTPEQMINLNDLIFIARGRSAEVFAYNEGTVVKLFNKTFARDHAESEAKIVHFLKNRGLPVPKVYRIVGGDQRWGIVYEKIEGVSMLSMYLENLSMVKEYSNLIADLHWKIHRIEACTLPCLKSLLFEKINDNKTLPLYQRNQISSILSSLADGNRLCHMDFHPDQILITKKGPCIIDWETGCRGNPIADVARTSIIIQVGQISEPCDVSTEELSSIRTSIRSAYLSRYMGRVTKDAALEFDLWEIVQAAARLGDGINGEENRLRLIIDTKIQKLSSGIC